MHCYLLRLLSLGPVVHGLRRRPPLHILVSIDIGKKNIHRDLSKNEQTQTWLEGGCVACRVAEKVCGTWRASNEMAERRGEDPPRGL